jgi:hypothetical protein
MRINAFFAALQILGIGDIAQLVECEDVHHFLDTHILSLFRMALKMGLSLQVKKSWYPFIATNPPLLVPIFSLASSWLYRNIFT